MPCSRLVLALLLFVPTSTWTFALADDLAPTTEVAAPADAGSLTVTGRVLLPDGSPAAGATVRVIERYTGQRPIEDRTDNLGAFRLRGIFGNGARLHASSADGKNQAIRFVAAGAARKEFEAPIVLPLAPAEAREITVVADGDPVTGVHVLVEGSFFRAHALTDNNGTAIVHTPIGDQLHARIAWHPKLGVAGTSDATAGLAENRGPLTLRPPGPHTFRVVDSAGRGIGDLKLGVSVETVDSPWISSGAIEAAHVRTAADGTAIVPWLPREKLRYVDVQLISDDWKIDDIDRQSMAQGITTVHVRRKRPISGRLNMPAGANAEGILITGFGFGPGGHGDIPYARARRDGSFTMPIPSDHAYVLGIADLEWASQPWSGLILSADSAEPVPIVLDVEPATPVTIRVTRGPSSEPQREMWIELSHEADVKWSDASGEKHTASAAVRNWLRTDSRGEAQAGVARGSRNCRLSSDNWNETRTIDVTSHEPVTVAFHRRWLKERKVTGRLLHDGIPYKPSPQLVARGWTQPAAYKSKPLEPRIRADGSFEVAFDAEHLSMIVVDPATQRGGFARIGPEADVIELSMQPTAVYSGEIRDENDRPLADQTLVLTAAQARPETVAAQTTTDRDGRFRFAAVPAGVPLELRLRNTKEGARYFIYNSERLFEPDEQRENDRVDIDWKSNGAGRPAPPPIPLAENVQRQCRDARLNRMHVLVLLQGDDSPQTVQLVQRLLNDEGDEDDIPPVLGYLPVRVTADQLKTAEETVNGFGWPKPGAGEIVLVALAGNGTLIANERIGVADPASAATRGTEFLKAHFPAGRDALVMLADAKKTARNSDRRVWVVFGGPRCGPCFRLARWMDDHHALLEKDFVIVKVGGLDRHYREANHQLTSAVQGIPWYAILEPDGTILTTSTGPLGNIGMPGTVEGLRHFRRMLEKTGQRLTAADVDELINSLSPQK